MTNRPAGEMPERPHRYHDEPSQPYWPTFIEKLLLTIIDAYPATTQNGGERAADKDRQRRLDAVMKELLGVSGRRGNKRVYQLPALIAATSEPAMTESMRAFESDILNIPKGDQTPRISRRTSIDRAAELAIGPNRSAKKQNLKRSERWARPYLQQLAVFGSHGEEDDMAHDLQLIRTILARWNVVMTIDFEALGMASLWGRKRHPLRPDTRPKNRK